MEAPSQSLTIYELLGGLSVVGHGQREVRKKQLLHAIVIRTHVAQQSQDRVIECAATQIGALST
jgi:hypothetical protein